MGDSTFGRWLSLTHVERFLKEGPRTSVGFEQRREVNFLTAFRRPGSAFDPDTPDTIVLGMVSPKSRYR
jgi:hypothetical protein